MAYKKARLNKTIKLKSSEQLTLDEWRKLIKRDVKLDSAFKHFGFTATN